MIYNKNGEMFFYEDKMFIIGEEVYATESAFYGFLGNITEIRTGDDRETENEGPEIYCKFRVPVIIRDKRTLNDSESSALDLVIMAPEMLMPTREVGGGLQKIKIFAVIEDCVDEGEDKSNIKLFAEQQHAEIIMRKSIEEEKTDGCISNWISSPLFVEEQHGDMYYTAYCKDDYAFNHYTVYIDELELTISIPFTEQMLPICLAMKYRNEVAEQIMPWDVPEKVKRTAFNDPSLYIRVETLLSDKELYKEEYNEAISEVAYQLTKEHAKIESLLEQAETEGILCRRKMNNTSV